MTENHHAARVQFFSHLNRKGNRVIPVEIQFYLGGKKVAAIFCRNLHKRHFVVRSNVSK